MVKVSRMLAAVLAITLLTAGCGGEDETSAGEDESSEPTTLTKDEYLAEANAVCARVNQDLQAAEDFQDGPPIIEQGLGELENIPRPEGDEEQLAEIYAEGQEAVAKLEGAQRPPSGDPFKKFTQLASDYGFKEGCSGNRG